MKRSMIAPMLSLRCKGCVRSVRVRQGDVPAACPCGAKWTKAPEPVELPDPIIPQDQKEF